MKVRKIMMGGVFALLMTAIPVGANAATVYGPAQTQLVSYRTYDGAYYGHRYMTCRDPRFRRHHRWLCW
jgi:hypothetical protein